MALFERHRHEVLVTPAGERLVAIITELLGTGGVEPSEEEPPA